MRYNRGMTSGQPTSSNPQDATQAARAARLASYADLASEPIQNAHVRARLRPHVSSHLTQPQTVAKDMGFEVKPAAARPPAQAAAFRQAWAVDPKDQNLCHMLSKGRLRLGELVPSSLWGQSWRFFLSLGLSMPLQVRRLFLECAAHRQSQVGQGWRLSALEAMLCLLCLLPGLHMLALFYLGARLLELEQENGYSSTEPIKAVWLAFFPPASLHYLQNKANVHWLLHAQNEWDAGKK